MSLPIRTARSMAKRLSERDTDLVLLVPGHHLQNEKGLPPVSRAEAAVAASAVWPPRGPSNHHAAGADASAQRPAVREAPSQQLRVNRVDVGSSIQRTALPRPAIFAATGAAPWQAPTKTARSGGGQAGTVATVELGQATPAGGAYRSYATPMPPAAAPPSAHPMAAALVAPVQAVRASSFVGSIGLNTHIGWLGTPQSNLPVVQAELGYVGVKHVRDVAPAAYILSAYASLAAAGITFDLIISNYATDVAAALPGNLILIDQLLRASPGAVFSIEGPNEVNAADNLVSYAGAPAGTPDAGVADAIMQAVYAAVRADPSLQGVPVLNLSLSNGVAGWQNYLARMGNMSSYVNGGNYHVYPTLGAQPGRCCNG